MERHDTLLIYSSSADNRAYLRDALGEGFNLLESVNLKQTVTLLKQNSNCIAALLLDITQLQEPEKEFLQMQKEKKLFSAIRVIVFVKNENTEQMNRAFGFGAADVIPIDYDPYAMLHRIENIVQLHLHRRNLEAMVKEQAQVLRQASDSMVDAMSSIIEYRSVESGQHILRIRHFTRILLEEVVRCCPEYNLTDRVISIICSAAALHDIGKIAIADSILLKPDRLTEEEREIMKTHTVTGCEILATLSNVAEEEYLRYAHNICHYHHERWDGGGYPEGLAGDEIPICAQVVGLADVYDALTAKRVYKEALPFAQAANMILNGECGVFSPKLLECFKHVSDKLEELARDYADGRSPKTEKFDTTLPAPEEVRNENSMERTRGKYFALAHYINGFLMDVDLDMGVFHVVYNPFPELADFQGVNTFANLRKMVLEELVHPDDREKLALLIDKGVENFLQEGLRRQSVQCRFGSKANPNGEPFEITLLRINSLDAHRRTLTVLVCRSNAGKTEKASVSPECLIDAVYSCRNDREFTLLELGSDTMELAGYTAKEIRESLSGSLIQIVHPEDRQSVRLEFDNQLKSGTDVKLEFRSLHKNGNIYWMLCKARLVLDGQGTEYLKCAVTDISGFKHSEEALRQRLERLEMILAQTENVLFEWDMAEDKIEFSNTWEKIFGSEPVHTQLRSELISGAYLHPDDLPVLFDAIGNLENGSGYEMIEVRIATARGRYLWCRIRATAIRNKNGTLEKISGIILNIDAEKQNAQLLQERAERDPLTKLLNKDAGRRQAEEYFARYPDGVPGAMLIIDLDNFKQVNDQYGHLFGDAVLTQVAREIKKLFRNQDIASRIGGDEFMVLMRGFSDCKLLESRCRNLLSNLRNVFHDQKRRLPLSCSVGVALSPEHGKTYYELFLKADQALYWAKANGKDNFVIYNVEDEKKYFYKGMPSAVNQRIDSDEQPGLANDNLVRYAFQRLYTSKNTERSVQDILELVGRKLNVSRVYVFENSDDNRYCNNTFEWCNDGVAPQIQNLQGVSYKDDIAGYLDMYNEQGIFYCPDVNELPKNIYDIVALQGIKSLLHCAIRDGGVFRGYIGFDECVEYRYWTKEQIQTLTYFSEMLAVFLLKQRKQEKALRYVSEMQSLLDNQNAWIYIIDPDTCQLKYLNAKTREVAPEIQTGMYCHKVLMGNDTRCPDCPALNIRQNKNGRKRMHNKRFDLETLADATLIRWEGEDACLLTCREIPRE